MAYQSEAKLELQFIEQLNSQKYDAVEIPDYDALVENFKIQFENVFTFTPKKVIT